MQVFYCHLYNEVRGPVHMRVHAISFANLSVSLLKLNLINVIFL